MVFSGVRRQMRDNQTVLYGVPDFNAQEESESNQLDIIRRMPEETQLNIKQMKLKHLNKVASTASPVLKTPKRV